MKKLLTSAAICGLVFAVAPAHAGDDTSAFELELGGYFKGYAFYSDVDEFSNATSSIENRDFDIVRETEIHFGGETTLDNGLTVGFHTETEADASPDNEDEFEVDESYAYFSGGWGRVNFGAEDGAAYLLQVAAPSADSNIDGIRQYINPVNYGAMVSGTGTGLAAVLDHNGTRAGLDYDQDVSSKYDKFTYLSPIMNGFQLGVSYTPEHTDSADEDATNLDDEDLDLGEVYDLALRYEGSFNNVGVIFGAGYTHAELEKSRNATVAPVLALTNRTDDRTAWNVGLDLDIGPFGIGAAYLEDDYGETVSLLNGSGGVADTLDDEEIFVLGVDYTTGAFKLGASYMDIENTGNIVGFTNTGVANQGIDSQRYAAGVTYTYGPGMTFRGSVSHVEHENVELENTATSGTDVEATTLTLGTQINF